MGRSGKKTRRRPFEERKRQIELVAIGLTTVLLIGLARLETRLYELSESLSQSQEFFTSIVYFGLINLNVILVLLLSFLIFRNITKVLVQRRRGVLGSKLRTKLIVTLVLFALLPTVLLFYVSTHFITTSFDSWFSERVRDTMQQTREAGAMVYKQDQRRLESLARIALQRIQVDGPTDIFVTDEATLDPVGLEGFETEYRLGAIKVYSPEGSPIWDSLNRDKSLAPSQFILEAIDRFKREPGLVSISTVEAEDKMDVVKGVAPILDPMTGQLLGVVQAEEKFETSILRSIEAILAEFADLRPGVQLISLSFQILLIVMTLLIVFSATWLGFYVAKEITGPIQGLAEATREVALGNYTVTLDSKTDDETGQLVRSFNQMTHDLRQHQAQADESKMRLETMNAEIDRRRRYMEVVLKHITAGVISVDANGKIASVNSAAENLLGVSATSAVGRTVEEGLGHGLYKTFWMPIMERVSAKSTYRGKLDLEDIGRKVTLIADAARICDENDIELGVVAVFTDATQQVNIQRAAAWREVARRIAHEIKNPLTPIQLSAQRLLRRFHDHFSADERDIFVSCIESILAQVDSLRNLVNEFSKFSRLPSVHARPDNINSVIEDVANTYRVSYPEVSFSLSGLSRVPQFPLDRDQMNRVFTNLVTNSMQAMNDAKVKKRKIEFRSKLVGDLNAVRIEVTDNGCGVPDEIKGRVLEPYFSTKSEGTGLGLAIVNQIVSEHGGYVRLSNNRPAGTKVVIDLPMGSEGQQD